MSIKKILLFSFMIIFVPFAIVNIFIKNDEITFVYTSNSVVRVYREETGNIDFAHNPFSMPQGGLESLEILDPYDIKAYQFDLVCNGYETLSGAVRNHDQELMVKAFELAGYSEDTVKQKFGALYNAFSYGAPPHAGCAFGFDRLLMLVTDKDIIREVIAFPMNKNARDLMMGAPSFVSEQQLKDVGIMLIPKENK